MYSRKGFNYKAPLHQCVHACRSLGMILVSICMVLSLSACVTTGTSYKVTRACGARDYCPERDGARQYVRAPDGWGGKYCLQNPTEC